MAMKGLVEIAVLALLCLASVRAYSMEGVMRFDCGTVDSPVERGYERLTADDVYGRDRGYGWESCEPTSMVFGFPKEPEDRGTEGRPAALAEHLRKSYNDLNSDAVTSIGDLAFRADVPGGTYRVTLTVGDMSQAIGSMDVYMNGRLVEGRVAAWTPGSYRSLMKNPSGWWTYVRGTVEATDGFIRVMLSKNQSYYDEQMAEQLTWENPRGLYWAQPIPDSFWGRKDPPYHYIGWPFVHNSVMAIEIVPHVPAPVVRDSGQLRLNRGVGPASLGESIAVFNEGNFGDALAAVKRVKEPEAAVAKALVELWLAGRLEVEKEKELVPEALRVLRGYVAAHPEENGVAEVLKDTETYQKAMVTHMKRVETGKNHFVENGKAVGLWLMIKDDSPLYYKSQLYAARAAHMLLPYIPTLGTAAEILKKLEEKFPDNRHVKYLLHWEWENHGDGTHPEDWYMVDYLSQTEGAPEWARQMQAAWATQVDWAEWWVKFKQEPEGNMGGGYGDDVEMVGALGYMDFVSKGVSELAMGGMRKFMEGLWYHSEVDPELGYCLPVADVPHTAEWTGDTLGVMVQVDYGNPVWIERSMKTGKLMRDLWTGYDVKGHRRFRSNHLGAVKVGSESQMNDDWACYRAVRPAFAVFQYNQNPTISELLVELADGWFAAAMSTERGKPEGVLPAMVSFPDAIIGGIHSPNWYTAADPPEHNQHSWTGLFLNENMFELFESAYVATGDVKYFEPLRMQYELAVRHGGAVEQTGTTRLRNKRGELVWEVRLPTRFGAEEVLAKWQPKYTAKKVVEEEAPGAGGEIQEEKAPPEPGSERWVAEKIKGLKFWLEAKRVMEGRRGSLEEDITLGEVIDNATYLNHLLKMKWPLDTTEAAATDRVGFPGWPNAFYIYTGGSYGGPLFEAPVTYVDTTKWFAAAVMGADMQGLHVLLCNMTEGTREIGIVPWVLEAGGKYVLEYGPDADEDGEMDSVVEKREFVLPQRGMPIRVTLEPNVTYVAEVEQVERGRASGLAPDPGLSSDDIRFASRYNLLLARVHNVGSKGARNVGVALYDGDPEAGGTLIGSSVIPNIEAPNDLEPRTVTVGVNWPAPDDAREIYVVVDPDDEIKDEITTFNNVAHVRVGE